MIACLLWDIDGTLIDTTSLIVKALDHTYRTFLNNTLSVNAIRDLIGIPLREQMLALGDPSAQGIDVAEMEREFIRFYETNRQLERVIPESIEALKNGYVRGWKTALVTSKNHAEIANTLPRLNIASCLAAVVTADDVTNPKPDPESVRKALAICHALPQEAIFIGDTIHDMRAGQEAGVRRCAVLWGAGRREQLEAESPDFICEDPAKLWDLLLSQA